LVPNVVITRATLLAFERAHKRIGNYQAWGEEKWSGTITGRSASITFNSYTSPQTGFVGRTTLN